MLKQIFLLSIILTTFYGSLSAQCTQWVRVLEYRGEGVKTPLANVEVVVGNASSSVTDKRGRCQLLFRTLKPGDKVNVRRVFKPKYEVLNPEVLDQWTISRSAEEEFVIVMVKSEFVQASRKNYMRAVEKSLKQEQTDASRQLKSNQITKAEYERKLKQLKTEYDEKLDDIDNYIEHIIHTDLTEISEQEREILNSIKNGDVSGALARYKQLNLLGTYRQQVQDKKTLEGVSERLSAEMRKNEDEKQRTYASVKRQNDLYRMVGGKENIEAGFKLWRDFAYADTTYVFPLFEYAQYCELSNRINEALDAVRYCYHSSDTIILLRANLLKLQLMSKKGQYRQIVQQLETTCHYMDSIRTVKGDNSLYLDERAYGLKLLCKAYTYMAEVKKGRRVRPIMVDVNHEAYEWDKNDTSRKRNYVEALYAAHRSVDRLDCSSMGSLKMTDNPLEKSTYLNDAIALQEELYREDPVRQVAMLAFLYCERARIHDNVARMTKDTTQYEETEKEFCRAIDLYNEAYSHNPKAYAHFLAISYFNYMDFLKCNVIGSQEKMLGLLEKAKEYEDQELQNNPNATRYTMGYILYGLGDVYKRIKEYEQAESYYMKAELEFQLLFNQYPKTYISILIKIYQDLLDLYAPDAKNDPEKREVYAEKIGKLETEYNKRNNQLK